MNVERHLLHSWEFSSSSDIKETSGKVAKNESLIVGLTVASAGVVIIIVSVMLWLWKVSYGDLVSATNNFSDERKLGQEGFGAVYKGCLGDLDMLIAVKRISRGSRQGKKEYITEVKIFSQLRHRNLVQLIGWCHDGGEFLLVYEFMPNGSLDSHLFGKMSPLIWKVR